MWSIVARHTNGKTIRYEIGDGWGQGPAELTIDQPGGWQLHIPLATVLCWHVERTDRPPWAGPIDEVVRLAPQKSVG